MRDGYPPLPCSLGNTSNCRMPVRLQLDYEVQRSRCVVERVSMETVGRSSQRPAAPPTVCAPLPPAVDLLSNLLLLQPSTIRLRARQQQELEATPPNRHRCPTDAPFPRPSVLRAYPRPHPLDLSLLSTLSCEPKSNA